MSKKIKLFRSEIKEKEYFDCYDKTMGQLPVPHDSQYIKTSYGDTHVIRCGLKENPKLVLLHCQGFSSMAWYYNLEQLSKHFEVFCIDSIGEPGKTKGNRTNIKNSDYASWLLEVLNGLRLEKPNIAGWSFGGFIAITFAMNYPEYLNKLVVMSPAACIAPISFAFFIKLFPALISGNEKKINRFLKWISGNDNNDFPNPAFTVFTLGMKNFKGWLRGTKLVVYTENDFKRIKAPVYMMIGENDPIYKKITPKELADKINKMLPNIIAETISGSHGFPIQNADIVNDKIISFLCPK